MPRDARFWRNVAIIAAAHLAILLALLRFNSGNVRAAVAPDMVWMSGDTDSQPTTISEPEAEPEPTPLIEKEKPQIDAPAKSEIQMPKPAPRSTSKPKTSASPKKIAIKKPLPKVVAASSAQTEKPAKKTSAALDGSQSAVKDRGASTSTAQQFSWYGNMLHDRFYGAWDQPTSVVSAGAKISALVKLRIEKDGRVSQFELVRPTGNVVVDESVSAVAKRVTRVDPPPVGLGGEHYDVRINFELNQD